MEGYESANYKIFLTTLVIGIFILVCRFAWKKYKRVSCKKTPQFTPYKVLKPLEKKGDGKKDFLIEGFPMEGHTLCFRKKKSTFVVFSFDTKKECPFKKEKLSLSFL